MSRLDPLSVSGNASPVAAPVGQGTGGASGPVTGESGPLRVPKPPLPQEPVPPSLGAAVVGPVRRDRLRTSLSPRDWSVLQCVAEHRFVSTDQVQRFSFNSHASALTAARTTRRVLARLARDGLLRSLPRRQGGPYGGSTPGVWQLAPAGARLLRGNDASNHRASVPTTRFLAHCLAVANTHLAALDTAAAVGAEPVVAIDPASARTYSGIGGETLTLRPDLALRLRGEDRDGHYEDAWFIEVDLGTESMPTLLKKCAQYEAYRAQGLEQAATGSFPLVLWVFTRSERAEELERRVAHTPSLTPALYRYTLLEPWMIHLVLQSENGGES